MAKRPKQRRTRIELQSLSDAALIDLTRAGTPEAFAELWSRHHGAVVAATRSFTRYEPEDLAQEAFAKVYASILRGGDMTISFRAYVATVSRRLAIDQSRRDRGLALESFDDDLDPVDPTAGDHAERALEKTTTTKAFKALSARQREVLWYRDVEELPVVEIARYLGLTENATSALIKRSREAFKASWISAQLSSEHNRHPNCLAISPMLARFARGTLTARDTAAVARHLSNCAHCAGIAAEADDLHRKLALVLLPLLLLGGAPGYLAWVRSRPQQPLSATQAHIAETPIVSPATTVSLPSAGVPSLRPAVVLAASLTGILLAGGAAFATGVLRAPGTIAAASDLTREQVQNDPGSPESGLPAPKDQSPSDTLDTASVVAAPRDSGAQTARWQGSTLRAESLPPAPSVQTPDPSLLPITSSSPPADPPASSSFDPVISPILSPPSAVVYPEYRELSTMSADSPFRFWISATPLSTVDLLIQEAGQPDIVLSFAIPTSGEVMYDFPQHRTRVIDITLTQYYATENGIIRSDALAFTQYPIPAH
ncbi:MULTISPECIES: sigma-70 family RNA polymerase sigma factor [unclassified Leucobacter]|uniref:sigma-70 family RNA polymerase sigma factor n=1 Tax=unclassified Leucobacter TaxID=2621730 RepID=UPI003019E77A